METAKQKQEIEFLAETLVNQTGEIGFRNGVIIGITKWVEQHNIAVDLPISRENIVHLLKDCTYHLELINNGNHDESALIKRMNVMIEILSPQTYHPRTTPNLLINPNK